MINNNQRDQLKIKIVLVLRNSKNNPIIFLSKQRTWKSKRQVRKTNENDEVLLR